MHKVIKLSIFAFFILLCSKQASAYNNKKAILLVSRTSQSDTTGYNFVNDLAAFVYTWVENGQVVLWDSPEKKATLGISDVKGIEKNSQASFTKLENIFVYENWTSSAGNFSFTVKGFSFTGANTKGEDVLFGFIEYNPALKELLKTAQVHLNANGNFGTTLYTILMNKGYQYSMVFFDNTALRDYKNSVRIVNKSINAKKKLANAVYLPQSKRVTYSWDSSVFAQAKISDQLTAILSDFFNQNKQEFFNYGGDKYYSFLRNSEVLISGFQVVQNWTKDKNNKITCSTISVIPYTVGIPLQPIPIQKLDEWKLSYNGIPLSEYLTNRDFPYAVKKINETTIPPQMAENFKNGLFAGNWNRILSIYLKGE